MEVFKLHWPDHKGVEEVATVFLGLSSGVRLVLGTARFPGGSLVPEEGYSVHSGDEVSLILRGKLEVGIEGKEEGGVIEAGEAVLIRAGVPHKARVLEDSFLVWMWLEAEAGGERGYEQADSLD